jgi:hypothetical protein
VGQSELVDDQGTRPQLLMPEPLAVKHRSDIGIGRGRKAGHHELKGCSLKLLADLAPAAKHEIDGTLWIANPLLTQDRLRVGTASNEMTSPKTEIRRYQLREHPLCAFCFERGIITAAEICDHVEPHHGDVNKFWLGPFQSLCKRYHDSTKRFVETRGFRPDIGLDGMPLDPRYPVYSRRR